MCCPVTENNWIEEYVRLGASLHENGNSWFLKHSSLKNEMKVKAPPPAPQEKERRRRYCPLFLVVLCCLFWIS